MTFKSKSHIELPGVPGDPSCAVPRSYVDSLAQGRKLTLQTHPWYHKITLPTEFASRIDVPGDIKVWGRTRDSLTYALQWDVSQLPEYSPDTPTIYIAPYIGDPGGYVPGNKGLTPQTPVRTITDAMTKVNALPGENARLVVITIPGEDRIYATDLQSLSNVVTSEKNLFVTSMGDDPVFSDGSYSNLSWSPTEETNVWQMSAPSSTVISRRENAVSDLRKTFGPIGMDYTLKAGLADVANTPGSFFLDEANERLYVRTRDDASPVGQTWLRVNRPSYAWRINPGGKRLTYNNMYFRQRAEALQSSTTSASTNTDHVICNNCTFDAFHSSAHAVTFASTRKCWLLNCTAFNAMQSGFSYRAGEQNSPMQVIEYNCRSYDNGFSLAQENRSSTTAGNGITILRINSQGLNRTYGSTLADIDVGTYACNIGCHMEVPQTAPNSFAYSCGGSKFWLLDCTTDVPASDRVLYVHNNVISGVLAGCNFETFSPSGAGDRLFTQNIDNYIA